MVRKATLLAGFEKVRKEALEVTDDVSIVEALGLPVKLTQGQYTNIKLTTPDDFLVAEQVLKDRASKRSGAQLGKSMPCDSERYREGLEVGKSA